MEYLLKNKSIKRVLYIVYVGIYICRWVGMIKYKMNIRLRLELCVGRWDDEEQKWLLDWGLKIEWWKMEQ